MTSEELYKNKEAYKEMFSILKKYENLPNVDTALCRIDECLQECKIYERWRINKPFWNYGYRYEMPWEMDISKATYIPNQNGERKCLGKPTQFFTIRLTIGAYILGNDYPEQLFDKFFEELIEQTNPKYVDVPNNKLYYTEETASNAYEVVQVLYKKYKEKYASESKAREIEQLKERLAQLESEQDESKENDD